MVLFCPNLNCHFCKTYTKCLYKAIESAKVLRVLIVAHCTTDPPEFHVPEKCTVMVKNVICTEN